MAEPKVVIIPDENAKEIIDLSDAHIEATQTGEERTAENVAYQLRQKNSQLKVECK